MSPPLLGGVFDPTEVLIEGLTLPDLFSLLSEGMGDFPLLNEQSLDWRR
jgi:hypothetical protein